MAYLGRQPNTGVRSRYIYTATASQTTFSGSDDDGKTLKYEDAAYLDVFLNGVLLKPVTDYTATSKTSVVLTSGAAVSDIVEIVAYDIANIADTVSKANGGTFEGNVNFTDNVKAIFGDGSDLQIYHDGSNSYIDEAGTGDLYVSVVDDVIFRTYGTNELVARFNTNQSTGGWARLYHRGNEKLETTSTGIDVTGKVHIYESDVRAPSADADDLVIEKTGDTGLSILSTTTGRIYFGDAAGDDQGSIRYVHSDDSMRFETGSSEAFRVDENGTFCIGKTTTSFDDSGINIFGYGTAANQERINITRSGGVPLNVNRLSSDGSIIRVFKDGTTVGHIGANGGNPFFATDAGSTKVGILMVGGSVPRVLPCNNTGTTLDNAVDLGHSSARYDDLWATNNVIQTSDANEKQDVAELDEAERRVATAAKGLIRKYRWISSVEEKGDDARIHVGIIAQDLKAAFEAEGLDPGRYAMFISTTWWEADETYTDDEGVEQTRTNTYDTAEEAPEGAVERTRLGVRYNQLLAFIIGAM